MKSNNSALDLNSNISERYLGFFININKIDKTLARGTRKERKKLNKQKMKDKDIDVPDLKNNEKLL